MKILVIIYSMCNGGAERITSNLTDEWAKSGWDVTLVTLTSGKEDFYPLNKDVRRIALDMASPSAGLRQALFANIRRVFSLRRVLRKVQPDVILGMMSASAVLGVLASLGLSCRVLAVEHTYPPRSRLGMLWRGLRYLTYSHADNVVALTEKSKSWLEEHCHCENVVVIPNSIALPLQTFRPVVNPRKMIDAGRKILLAVGRLSEEKGFDDLISVFSRIAGHFDNWDLVIVGEGPEREKLESQVHQSGQAGRIWLPGRVGNVADWYGISDLYVMTSRFEGFPNSLIEAMASGCAVVSYDCDTGPGDIIRDGQDGLLVSPVGDVDALEKVMACLMTDEDERRRLAQNAVAVLDRFSTAKILGRWNRILIGNEPDRLLETGRERV